MQKDCHSHACEHTERHYKRLKFIPLEFLAESLHTLNIAWIGILIVVEYLVTIGVYSAVTYTIHSIRYGRAKKGVAAYERKLGELEALYEEEER